MHLKSYLHKVEQRIRQILLVYERTAGATHPKPPSCSLPEVTKFPEYYQHLHGLAYGNWTRNWAKVHSSRDSHQQMNVLLQVVSKLDADCRTVFWHRITGGKWKVFHVSTLKYYKEKYDLALYLVGCAMDGIQASARTFERVRAAGYVGAGQGPAQVIDERPLPKWKHYGDTRVRGTHK